MTITQGSIIRHLDGAASWDGFWSSFVAAIIGGAVSIGVALLIVHVDGRRAKARELENRSMAAAEILIMAIVECAEGFKDSRDGLTITERRRLRTEAGRTFRLAVRGKQNALGSEKLRTSVDLSRKAAGEYRLWCDKRDTFLATAGDTEFAGDSVSVDVFKRFDNHLVSVRQQLQNYQRSGEVSSDQSTVPFATPPPEKSIQAVRQVHADDA